MRSRLSTIVSMPLLVRQQSTHLLLYGRLERAVPLDGRRGHGGHRRGEHQDEPARERALPRLRLHPAPPRKIDWHGQRDAPKHSRRAGGSAHLSSFDERARALSGSPHNVPAPHQMHDPRSAHQKRAAVRARSSGWAGSRGGGGRRRGGIRGRSGILTGCDQIRQVPWISNFSKLHRVQSRATARSAAAPRHCSTPTTPAWPPPPVLASHARPPSRNARTGARPASSGAVESACRG